MAQSMLRDNYPFQFAIIDKDVSKVNTLIALETDVNLVDEFGDSPLLIAIQTRDVEMASILINSGANINFVKNDGTTPLLLSVENIHFKMLSLLINAGADVNVSYKGGTTPLHLACRQLNLMDVIESDIKDTKYDGTEALNKKLDTLQYELVELLLTSGANPKVIDSKGNSPLHLAGKICNKEIIKLLLGAGLKLDDKNNEGDTALHPLFPCELDDSNHLVSEVSTTECVTE